MPGAARTQVTGPVYHFVGFPTDESVPQAWFLGTSKQTPRIRVDRHYAPYMSEEGGEMVPTDLAYQGKEARIITELNLFDYRVAYALGCSPRFTRSRYALGRGLESFRDIGSLMLGNKCYFTLYLVFPFAGSVNDPPGTVPANFGVGFPMPLVYRFPACMIEYDEQTAGTDAQSLTLAIYAQRIHYSLSKYKQRFGSSPLAGGFFLFDHRSDLLDWPRILREAIDLQAKIAIGIIRNEAQSAYGGGS